MAELATISNVKRGSFSWKIGGEAGYGILSAGAMFSRTMLRLGFHVFDYPEYPSLIRGGHNTYEVTISDKEVFAPKRPINVLICLNQETADIHKEELADDALVIYNTDNTKIQEGFYGRSITAFGIPLETLALEAGIDRVARNTVALGATMALLKFPFEKLQEIIELNFRLKKKGDQVIEANVKAAKLGFDYLKEKYKSQFNYRADQVKLSEGRLIMTGNDAIAWGAIQAGVKFYSAYPMTPASSILHTLAKQSRKYKLAVKHVEDEISAINAAIGASFAGVRSMTGTSGGGFSLMTEAWGMAAIMELPLVVVEAMRGGPSTGIPTWTSQADLKFLLSASQGEFPRFVIAPGDVEQCFVLIQEAFNIADKYQTPVMFVTDKMLAASHQSVNRSKLMKVGIDRGKVLTEKEVNKEEKFLRYRNTSDGISPRTFPGTKGGEFVCNSDEHNEKGFSEENAEEVVRMMDKRFKKISLVKSEIPDPEIEGEKKADLTIISWGSTRGAILTAIDELKKEGITVNFVQIKYISPFPVGKIKEVFSKAKKIAVVEGNKTGQLAGWIREQTGLVPDYKILKYDGRPFFPDELVRTIKDLK